MLKKVIIILLIFVFILALVFCAIKFKSYKSVSQEPFYLSCEATCSSQGYAPYNETLSFIVDDLNNTVTNQDGRTYEVEKMDKTAIELKLVVPVSGDMYLRAAYSIDRVSGTISGSQFATDNGKLVGRFETVKGTCSKMEQPKF